jgi:hypothetical protein
MQVIETSSIAIRADEVIGRCLVDVFSCRPSDAELAAGVAVARFGGRPTLRVSVRVWTRTRDAGLPAAKDGSHGSCTAGRARNPREHTQRIGHDPSYASLKRSQGSR